MALKQNSIFIGKPGKLPAKVDKRTLDLTNFVDPLKMKNVPIEFDWTTKKKTPWGMMDNFALSDCTCAAAGHMIECWTASTTKEHIVRNKAVMDAFIALTGYDPLTGKNDNGVFLANALKYWRKIGIGNHKIKAYASINYKKHDLVKAAIYVFGGIYVGINLPNSIKGQDIWDINAGGLKGDNAPGSFGGHAVTVLAYDETHLTCVSWGKEKKMTWKFWDTYCDELYAIITEDFFNKSNTPLGVDLSALEAQLLNITKAKKTFQKELIKIELNVTKTKTANKKIVETKASIVKIQPQQDKTIAFGGNNGGGAKGNKLNLTKVKTNNIKTVETKVVKTKAIKFGGGNTNSAKGNELSTPKAKKIGNNIAKPKIAILKDKTLKNKIEFGGGNKNGAKGNELNVVNTKTGSKKKVVLGRGGANGNELNLSKVKTINKETVESKVVVIKAKAIKNNIAFGGGKTGGAKGNELNVVTVNTGSKKKIAMGNSGGKGGVKGNEINPANLKTINNEKVESKVAVVKTKALKNKIAFGGGNNGGAKGNELNVVNANNGSKKKVVMGRGGTKGGDKGNELSSKNPKTINDETVATKVGVIKAKAIKNKITFGGGKTGG